jgi:hypothetical protein
MTLFLRLSRTELSPSHIKMKCRRPFPLVTAGPITLPLMCFHKDQIVRIGTDATLQACVFSGRIVALRPHQAGFIFGQIGIDTTLQACAYSGQIGASTPHQADFTFGQIGTDATLQACAYSGQIGASTPHQADFTFVKSGPTPRSKRALTQAKSGPPRRIKRTSPLVKLGPTPRSRRALTQAKSGPPCRIKRTSAPVTTISDRLGSCALNAARARAVTYPTEGRLEDNAPLRGGGIASTALRKHTQKKKNLGTRGWGNTDLYYMSETGYKGPPR